jgi:hypothetical protein
MPSSRPMETRQMARQCRYGRRPGRQGVALDSIQTLESNPHLVPFHVSHALLQLLGHLNTKSFVSDGEMFAGA